VVPKPSASAFDSQRIEEKLSARNGTSATKGTSSVGLTVRSSTTSAAAIGPQLACVTLGFSGSKARSTVYFTSEAVSGLPSWQVTPSASVNVYSVPASFASQDFAMCGTGSPSASVASSVS